MHLSSLSSPRHVPHLIDLLLNVLELVTFKLQFLHSLRGHCGVSECDWRRLLFDIVEHGDEGTAGFLGGGGYESMHRSKLHGQTDIQSDQEPFVGRLDILQND